MTERCENTKFTGGNFNRCWNRGRFEFTCSKKFRNGKDEWIEQGQTITTCGQCRKQLTRDGWGS